MGFNTQIPMYGGAWMVEVSQENLHLKIRKYKKKGVKTILGQDESTIYLDEATILELAKRLQMRNRRTELRAELEALEKTIGKY